MPKVERKEVFEPIECECAKCGSKKAWIVPFGGPHGQTWCPRCTFGKPDASLTDMLKLVFGKKGKDG